LQVLNHHQQRDDGTNPATHREPALVSGIHR
jgi:hypothetical protein